MDLLTTYYLQLLWPLKWEMSSNFGFCQWPILMEWSSVTTVATFKAKIWIDASLTLMKHQLMQQLWRKWSKSITLSAVKSITISQGDLKCSLTSIHIQVRKESSYMGRAFPSRIPIRSGSFRILWMKYLSISDCKAASSQVRKIKGIVLV